MRFYCIVLIGAFISINSKRHRAESFETCCQWALYLMCKRSPYYFHLLYRSIFILLSVVHAGSFRVSVIHRPPTWTTGSSTCVHSYACDTHGGEAHQQVSTTFWLGKTIKKWLCSGRGLNLWSWNPLDFEADTQPIDDVHVKKKREQTAACTKQSCELSRHRNRTNIRLAVFWLFVMFAESQIKASERDPEYCKKWLWNVVLGERVIQAADLEKDCNSFTLCVAIGIVVLGVRGITLLSFFFRNRSIEPLVTMSPWSWSYLRTALFSDTVLLITGTSRLRIQITMLTLVFERTNFFKSWK